MSGIATGTALAIGLGTAASVGTSIYGSTLQAGAAQSAAQLDYQAQQNALAFQEQEWNQQQANQAPWIHAGQGAVSQLSDLLSTPGQGLLTPWTQQFHTPTAAEAAAYPGEQFMLNQGQQAIQRSAAAQGGLLSGGTAKALNNYAQGVASTDYQNVYNNQFQNYLQNYNQFQNNQANTYNRLAGLSGEGQQSATTLGQQGGQAAGNVGNIYLTGAQQIGNNLQNAAYQTASGYNAASGGINNLSQLALLRNLLGNQGGSPYPVYNPDAGGIQV